MNLKLLAGLTVVASIILVIIGFVFNMPIAYVPENATYLEYVFYHVAFVIVELIVIVSLFLHMIKTADVDMSDVENLFSLRHPH